MAVALGGVLLIAACGATVTPTPSPSSTQTPAPTPSPTPTPQPTPTFTNAPDSALSALIPAAVGDRTVEQPPVESYGLTPGDIGEAAYGELGARFRSLVIAFVRSPRLSLYAMRVDPPAVTTADLEPHLATAGRYVGIAGLQREPWELADVAGHWVWVRPSDGATLAGTRVYTWAADGYVFLMIGVDDAQNQALLALLPGEVPPTPSPAPSDSPGASGTGEPSPGPSGS
jgi:hypothetical protein